MSLFDNLKEAAAKQFNLPNADTLTLAQHAWGWVQGNGGLNGVVEKFKSQGLQPVVQSWIGTGANLAITPEQVQNVLGKTGLTDLAAKAGISPEMAAQKLSALLPTLVDKLTPNGAVPNAEVTPAALLEAAKSLTSNGSAT